MNRAPAVVSRIEELGGYLALDVDGNIRYRVPKDSPEAQALLETVKAQKEDLRAYLKARRVIPVMPRGVRLIRWKPKAAPVAIDVCSVVVEVPKFIDSELRALDSRLNNPWTIRGGFTVPLMLDRLAQAGVEVELDPKGGADCVDPQEPHCESPKSSDPGTETHS